MRFSKIFWGRSPIPPPQWEGDTPSHTLPTRRFEARKCPFYNVHPALFKSWLEHCRHYTRPCQLLKYASCQQDGHLYWTLFTQTLLRFHCLASILAETTFRDSDHVTNNCILCAKKNAYSPANAQGTHFIKVYR